MQYFCRGSNLDASFRKLDLPEIQSLCLDEIVEHKARHAFAVVGSPVLVEDVSLEIASLNKLPGPFVKWFLVQLKPEGLCQLVDASNRAAIARCTVGYMDQHELKLFHGHLEGTIAEAPRGGSGYGWDPIFIPAGYQITRAEMTPAEDDATYFKLKPFHAVGEYLRRRSV